MTTTKFTVDVQNVQALNDRPNSNTGLTADQVKAVFDKAGEDIKDYINNTLTPEIDSNSGINLDIYNVMSYGALGDGTNNDTTSIQLALDAVDDAGGGTVFFPAGTFIISAKLLAGQNTYIRGAGMNLTFINWLVSNLTVDHMIEFTQNTGQNRSGALGFELNQKRSERSLLDYQTYGGILASSHSNIEGVRIHNTAGPGITQATIEDIKIRDCEIYDTGHHPIYFSTGNGGYVKNVEIINNDLGTPATIVGRLLGADVIKFRFANVGDLVKNITIEKNRMGSGVLEAAIFISTTSPGALCILKNISIKNNEINKDLDTANAMTYGIYIGDNSYGKNISIVNNNIYGSGVVGSYGVRNLLSDLTLTNNVSIRNNTIANVEIAIDSNKAMTSENDLNFTKYGFVGIQGKVFNNTFTSSTNGAIAIRQSTCDQTDNIINMSGTSTIGIDFGNLTNVLILRNRIDGAVIAVQRNAKTLTGCVLDQQIFTNCGTNYSGVFNSTATMQNNLIEPSTTIRSGTTANRPTKLYAGQPYFDTTLGKIINVNAALSGWVDATGAAV